MKVNIVAHATIQAAIMTSAFRLSSFLPYRLAVLSERVSRRLAAEYGRTHGLSVAEWRVLAHLQHGGQVSVRDIRDCVDLDKPRVSRAVARLEAAGLVEKTAGADDGRLVAISLTPKGRAVLAEIIPEVSGVESRLLSALDPGEIEAFYAVMEKIHAVLDADPKARPRARLDPLRSGG